MLSRYHHRFLFVSGLVAPPSVCAHAWAYARSPEPLTLQDLVQKQELGLDNQAVIEALAVNGVSLDTLIQEVMPLLNSAGIHQEMINAKLIAVAWRSIAIASPKPAKRISEESAAYVKTKDYLTLLPVEVVKLKTSGVPGYAFTFEPR